MSYYKGVLTGMLLLPLPMQSELLMIFYSVMEKSESIQI